MSNRKHLERDKAGFKINEGLLFLKLYMLSSTVEESKKNPPALDPFLETRVFIVTTE